MPVVGDAFSFSGPSGRKGHGGKHVILDADGNVVAHVWGRVQVVNTNFKLKSVMGGRAYGKSAIPELEARAAADIVKDNDLTGDGIF